MGIILTLDENTVVIGMDNKTKLTLPRTVLNYENPQIGDSVQVEGSGEDCSVTLLWGYSPEAAQNGPAFYNHGGSVPIPDAVNVVYTDSPGYTAQGATYSGPQGNSYSGPQGNSYSGPQGNSYSGPQGNPYGGPQGNPYGGPQGNSYGGPQGGTYDNYYSQNQGVGYAPGVNHINKHLFIWLGVFFFGSLGADRFIRGQILLGVLKLITGGGLGIWWLVDFIIALIKVYGGAYQFDEDVIFINGQYSK